MVVELAENTREFMKTLFTHNDSGGHSETNKISISLDTKLMNIDEYLIKAKSHIPYYWPHQNGAADLRIIEGRRDVLKKFPDELIEAYNGYIRDVSNEQMTASMECSALLYNLCVNYAPSKVLDLGSGFSSFVFRHFSKHVKSTKVVSIDDDRKWLEKTRSYLRRMDVPCENVIHLESFTFGRNLKEYDLVFHDVGSMLTRKHVFDEIINVSDMYSGIIVLDDMHKAHYRTFVFNSLLFTQYDYYDIEKMTLDNLGRYAGIIAK